MLPIKKLLNRLTSRKTLSEAIIEKNTSEKADRNKKRMSPYIDEQYKSDIEAVLEARREQKERVQQKERQMYNPCQGSLKRINSNKIMLTRDYYERSKKSFPNYYHEEDGKVYDFEGKEITIIN